MSEEPQEQSELDSFDFELPAHQIAQHPPASRQDSRLLVLERTTGATHESTTGSLEEQLRGDEAFVINDTQVVPARLLLEKPTGGKVELLVTPQAASLAGDMAHCMYRANKPLRAGARLAPASHEGPGLEVAEVYGGGRALVDFSALGGVLSALHTHGQVPLPPYIHRDSAEGPNQEDRDRYQTIYARHPGAVAAPTAGLHLTASLLSALERKGIPVVRVTLHVGPGTFLPVRANLLANHRVEPEWCRLDPGAAEQLNQARVDGRRIIAVGTTSVRTLETAVQANGRFLPHDGLTDLTIVPGHAFAGVDGLLTNFHLPKSSLLVLVASFAGKERVLSAYRRAVDLGFRFYSYGDALWIQ